MSHKRHKKIQYWDDERDIGNSIIVTLKRGYKFEEEGEHVRGFDTIKEAMNEVRQSSPCYCEYCNNN